MLCRVLFLPGLILRLMSLAAAMQVVNSVTFLIEENTILIQIIVFLRPRTIKEEGRIKIFMA